MKPPVGPPAPDNAYDTVALRAWTPGPRKPVAGATPVARVRYPWARRPVPLYDLADTRPMTEAEERVAPPATCARCALHPPRPCTCLCALCANKEKGNL